MIFIRISEEVLVAKVWKISGMSRILEIKIERTLLFQ